MHMFLYGARLRIDFKGLGHAADPRLWSATSYCMPLEVRKTLLGFSDERSRADLERCQQNVERARYVPPTTK